MSDRVVEQIVDAHVRQIREQIVEVARVMPQERLQLRKGEQIADVPIHLIRAETGEVTQLILQGRISLNH